MTILVDHHEPPEIDLMLAPIEVSRGEYNSSGSSALIYPDYVIVGGSKLVGCNRKQVGEVLSSLDKVEEQLQRELAGPCEHLLLYIEGIMIPDKDGCWGYTLDWSNQKVFNNVAGTIPFKRQHYSVNWKHVQNWQTRLEFKGIQIVHTYNLYDTASRLVALHDMVLKDEPNKVLDRLIKTDIQVLALDKQEKDMALTLMGIRNGSVGEEIALALAQSFSSITELIDFWRDGGQCCDTMLRSGTRRIGNAAEAKLQRALGYTPGSPSPDRIRQDTEASYLPSA